MANQPMKFEDDDKKGKRKWQCFVCGNQHGDYESYKSHIVAEHDEGREYLSCPDCKAPVREMRTHYAAKHPHRVLPKDGPMRVSVWFDFVGNKRKARKPKFRDGFIVSNKNGGKELHYRSGYECEVYELLEHDDDVRAFHVEPFKVPYNFGGEWLEYIPDLRVDYMDGTTEIWEIKPANQTSLDKNKAKWLAMDHHATQMGWRFMVITEVGIGKLRQKLKEANRPS
jgi:hypothetical protein